LKAVHVLQLRKHYSKVTVDSLYFYFYSIATVLDSRHILRGPNKLVNFHGSVPPSPSGSGRSTYQSVSPSAGPPAWPCLLHYIRGSPVTISGYPVAVIST